MDIDELKGLLPFYVAGTLAPDMRRELEDALLTSDELRKELLFWKRAQEVVAARAAEAAEGHLSSQQIVDRATGMLKGEQVLSVDQHLQTCKQCSDEFRTVKASFVASTVVVPSVVQKLLSPLKSVRMAYALPLATAIIAIVVLYFSKTEKQVKSGPAPSVAPPTIAQAQVNETASLWLTYRPELRSASRQGHAALSLAEGVSHIRVSVAIPRNQVSGIRYNVTIASPGSKPYRLKEQLQRYASAAEYDSLEFVISRELLPPAPKNMTVTISEVLPQALRSLSPEEYRFEVDVVSKGQGH